MNTYNCTNGDRVTQSVIDRNIRKAKEIKKHNFIKEHGYKFCEFTGVNESAAIIDPMHIISVDQCKKMGRADLARDQRNLRYGARSYHVEFDNQLHQRRIEIFEELNNCKL